MNEGGWKNGKSNHNTYISYGYLQTPPLLYDYWIQQCAASHSSTGDRLCSDLIRCLAMPLSMIRDAWMPVDCTV